MAKRALIIMMKPALRAEFKKYLEKKNAKTDRDVLVALKEFIKEKGIKTSYIREGETPESQNTGGHYEEDNPLSGSPFLN